LGINELYSEADSGNKSAENELFKYLLERFGQFAHHRIWNKEDARDIAQEAVMLIAKEYKSISFEVSFQAWAYKVLNNKILSYIKKRRQRGDKVVTVADLTNVGEQIFEPDTGLRTKLLDCLGKIGNLNRRFARIIDLHYLGFMTSEVCEKLNLSRDGFYSALHRARKMLEICLKTGDVK